MKHISFVVVVLSLSYSQILSEQNEAAQASSIDAFFGLFLNLLKYWSLSCQFYLLKAF